MLKPAKNPYGFQNLLAYKKAEELQSECRRITRLFPGSKTIIDLADQMDRSARSGKQNIVEGWKRNTTQEYFTFLGFSIGAVAELEEDCNDIWKGRYPELEGVNGVMGEERAKREGWVERMDWEKRLRGGERVEGEVKGKEGAEKGMMGVERVEGEMKGKEGAEKGMMGVERVEGEMKEVEREARVEGEIKREERAKGANPIKPFNPINPLNSNNPLNSVNQTNNSLNPFNPIRPLFDIEKLPFYPLDQALPPIVQLKLRSKELNYLLYKLQTSLEAKMKSEKTLSASAMARERLQEIKQEKDATEDFLRQNGFRRLENGQVVADKD